MGVKRPSRLQNVADNRGRHIVTAQLEGPRYRPHRILGYSDAPVGGSPCSLRAERPLDPWRHLFTLGYDKRLGFAIKRFGRVQFLLSPADLQAGRFTRACGFFTRY